MLLGRVRADRVWPALAVVDKGRFVSARDRSAIPSAQAGEYSRPFKCWRNSKGLWLRRPQPMASTPSRAAGPMPGRYATRQRCRSRAAGAGAQGACNDHFEACSNPQSWRRLRWSAPSRRASGSELQPHAAIDHEPVRRCPCIDGPATVGGALRQHHRVIAGLAHVEDVLEVEEQAHLAERDFAEQA
jgi:hypothetical protein